MLLRYSARRARVVGVETRVDRAEQAFEDRPRIDIHGQRRIRILPRKVFVYAQLEPVSQLPTMRESSQPSCSDGTRVSAAQCFAAT